MKKYTFLLFGLFSIPSFASVDCDRAMPMTKETVHYVVQAMKMHKRDATYQEIAQWRVNTFTPQIDRIETENTLTPQDMMNPDLELTRVAYNDVVMRAKIYVNQVYSYARGGTTKESVNEQRVLISDSVNQIYGVCAPKK